MTEENGLNNKHENNLENKKKRKNKQLQNLVGKEKKNEIEEKNKVLNEDGKSNFKEDPEQINNDNKKKRKRKEVFPFGNYRSYYGYRIGQGVEEDPRIRVFDRKWFEGKDCLDIGCNCGIVTIQTAKKFCCRKILGIDIDSDRIADAYWHLRKTVRAGQAGKVSTKVSEPDSTRDTKDSQHSTAALSVEEKEFARDGLCPDEIDLFDIVSFKRENFVLSWCQEEQYDTILCLSVTKWIHLNWGDKGLITSFSKIWRLLRPGGILVLEPQPWKSYENNRLVSETTAMNYRSIKFRPEQFTEILLDKIGFRKVQDLTSALPGSKAGFNRPIFAYHK